MLYSAYFVNTMLTILSKVQIIHILHVIHQLISLVFLLIIASYKFLYQCEQLKVKSP